MVVLLQDVVEAMELPNDAWASYLNPKTGEIVTVTDEGPGLPGLSSVAG